MMITNNMKNGIWYYENLKHHHLMQKNANSHDSFHVWVGLLFVFHIKFSNNTANKCSFLKFRMSDLSKCICLQLHYNNNDTYLGQKKQTEVFPFSGKFL